MTFEEFQRALHSLLFTQRQYAYLRLQHLASARVRPADQSYVLAWPDVLGVVAPEDFRQAVQEARDATPTMRREALLQAGGYGPPRAFGMGG